MKIFISVVFIIISFAGATLAQDKVEISNDPPPPAVRFPMVREVGKAQVSYNEKKDETIARTKGDLVFVEGTNELRVAAEFVSAGKKVNEPTAVTLKIFYFGKDRGFLDDRTFKVSVDGKEIISGTSKFIRANESNFILGALERDVSFTEFKAISDWKEVRMQIGPAKSVLGVGIIQAFNDLVRTIEK